MTNMVLKLGFRAFLPPEWRDQIRKLRKLKVFTLGDFALVSVLVVLTVGFEAFGMAMIVPLLDFINQGRDIGALAADSRMWRVIQYAYDSIGLPVSLVSLSGVVLALITLRQLVNYAATVTVSRLKQRVGRNLQVGMFEQIMRGDGQFIQEFGTGPFVHAIHHHCQATAALTRTYADVLRLMITVAMYACVIVAVAPAASALAFAVALSVILSLSHYVKLTRKLGRRIVFFSEAFAKFLSERYRGWRLIKLGNVGGAELNAMRDWASQLYTAQVELIKVAGRMQLVVAPVIAALTLVALYVSVEILNMTVAVITMFVLVLLRLVPVAQGFASKRQSIAMYGANLNRVVEIFAQARKHRELDHGTVEFVRIHQAIEFLDVSFRYGADDNPALHNITARIPAAAVTAVVGPSGAGKSTLVDMLPRLLLPTSGTILLDGKPLRDFTLSSLRSRIEYVPQRPTIFDMSVLDNVRYSKPNATMAEVVEACRLAHADEFIAEMAGRYETYLGEEGARLSGGQRQRLVLARSFLSESSLLILDEPTSALDYESERKVQEAMRNFVSRHGTTVIIIAHRLSSARKADHLVVLDKGQVVEQGPPAELIGSGGWFATMLASGDFGAEVVDNSQPHA